MMTNRGSDEGTSLSATGRDPGDAADEQVAADSAGLATERCGRLDAPINNAGWTLNKLAQRSASLA